MDWSNIREGELKEIFDALEAAFAFAEVDYYILSGITDQ